MDPTVLGYGAAIATVLLWGLVAIPVKKATTGGQLGIAISMPVGLLGLIAALIVTGEGCPAFSALLSPAGLWIVLGGLFEFPLATIFYYESIQRCEISLAAPLTRLKIVFVALIVLVLGIEAISVHLGLACVLGVMGAVVLTFRRPSSLPSAGQKSLRLGMMYAVLASFFWAVGDIFMKYALKTTPALPATLFSLLAGMVIYYAYIAVTGKAGDVLRMPRRDKLLYCCHGLVSFALGYYAFYVAIHNIGVTKAAVITASWPLVTFLAGVAYCGERLSVAKVVGVLLIMASVFLAIV